MKKILVLLMSFTLIGCFSQASSGYEKALAAQHKAQKEHPDMDFGTVRQTGDNQELIGMTANHWSIYLTLPGRDDGGGWDYIIMSRKKQK